MSEVNKDIIVEEKVENEVSKKQPKVKIGVVDGCVKLNIRKAPSVDSEIITEVASGTEVQILGTSKDFYHICTAAGIDGFCMKKFVNVK